MNEITVSSAALPMQTHNFAWNVVDGLRKANVDVSLLSALPIPNYPEYPRVFIRSVPIQERGVSGISLGFINLLALKHVTRLLSCFTTGWKYIATVRPDVVVVHGVHSPFLLYARLLKRFARMTICAILTDPPGIIRPRDGAFVRSLKWLDRKVVEKLCSGFDGVIALAPTLAKDLAAGVPVLVMEGIATQITLERTAPDRRHEVEGAFVLAYAGGLTAEYGVKNLVLAVEGLHQPGVRLDLYGRGPLEEWILERASRDPRLHYHGAISRDELLPRLARADLLVNPRPVEQEFVKYSFPSKLLEYMSLGVPVLSTRLPSIPVDYDRFLTYPKGDTPTSLMEAITQIMDMSLVGRRRKADKARQFVLREKGVSVQGKRMAEFLSALAKGQR